MMLTIPLTRTLEDRLAKAASRQGLEPAELVRRLIEERLDSEEPAGPDTVTLGLLDKWETDNATTDPEEIARREKEGEELMQSLARNRFEMEGPNARKLWP